MNPHEAMEWAADYAERNHLLEGVSAASERISIIKEIAESMLTDFRKTENTETVKRGTYAEPLVVQITSMPTPPASPAPVYVPPGGLKHWHSCPCGKQVEITWNGAYISAFTKP